MISVSLNGVKNNINEKITISKYLDGRLINPDHVVVEVNKIIVGKEKFDHFEFKDGDQIEILRFVGGG